MIFILALTLLPAIPQYVGNGKCASCHAEIFRKYMRTPMAQSSGRVRNDVPKGRFVHRQVAYDVSDDGLVKHSGEEHRVEYFIGSAAAGRSYLYSWDGFLFQAPITWYSQKTRWDVSPGYERDDVPRWNRPIEPSCLNCHASQARPIYGTQNRYTDPPFAQNGIGCERCHGPASEHVRGDAKLVNPAKLGPPRRDDVCSQCHLTGEVRIDKTGKKLGMYRPGDKLGDYVSHFFYEGGAQAGLKATSHVERIDASRCKLVSGDKLWCGACHDPHTVPSQALRVTWFREKCMKCHEEAHRREENCVGCHMPRERVVDGGHGVLTDHSIPRRPRTRIPASEGTQSWRLTGPDMSSRELGLAYAEVALRTGDRRQSEEAVRLLTTVPLDAAVAVRLADLYQRKGNQKSAQTLYETALKLDPNSVVTLVNLGAIYASSGDIRRAIPLWREALKRNPLLTEAQQNIRAAEALQSR